MDRNDGLTEAQAQQSMVALRKESVDRNLLSNICAASVGLSLSARRAWIEIRGVVYLILLFSVALRKESVDRNLEDLSEFESACVVALRKESVDRNTNVKKSTTERVESLSARRAWIEIAAAMWAWCSGACRSPQGERG